MRGGYRANGGRKKVTDKKRILWITARPSEIELAGGFKSAQLHLQGAFHNLIAGKIIFKKD